MLLEIFDQSQLLIRDFSKHYSELPAEIRQLSRGGGGHQSAAVIRAAVIRAAVIRAALVSVVATHS